MNVCTFYDLSLSFYSKYYADGGNEEIDNLFNEMDYFKNGWDFGADFYIAVVEIY